MKSRGMRLTIWALALSPIGWFALFWMFVFRARLQLGNWPTLYNPDPVEIGWLHYMTVQMGIPWIFSATITLLLMTICYWRLLKDAGARPALAAAVGSVSLAAICIIARYPPVQRFFHWLAD